MFKFNTKNRHAHSVHHPIHGPIHLSLTLLATLVGQGLTSQALAQSLEPMRTTRGVTITGTTIDDRFGDSARDPSSTTTLSGRKIESQHAANLVEVLRSVPGITVDYAGGDELKIKFRGVENQRYMGEKPGVAIVIDGVPVYERTGKVNINLDNIESIKIVKGGASYLYGEDALSGAVVITTKRGATHKGGAVEADRGAYGYQRQLGRLGFANDEWSGHLQMSRRSSDEYHFQSNYWSHALGGNLRWAPDAQQDLTLGIELEDRFRDKHGVVTGVTQAATDPQGVIGRDYARHFDVALDRTNLTYSNNLSADTNLLALIYQYRDHTRFWSAPQRFSSTGAAVTSSDAYTTNNDYHQTQRGLKSELRSTLSASMAVLGGLEIKRNEYQNLTSARVSYKNSPSPTSPVTTEGTVFGDDDTVEATRALYGEAKWSPAADWTLTGNLRHDLMEIRYDALPVSGNGNTTLHESKSFGHSSWRLGAAWAASEHSTWFGNMSTGFRAPTVDQLYRGSMSPTGNVANNPDLKPETATNLEFGLRSSFGLFGRSSSVETTVFQIDRKDFILDTNGQYASSNASHIGRYENIGGVRSRGLELALKSSLSEALGWDLAYTYLDSRFTQYDTFQLALGNPRGTLVGSTAACTPGNAAFSWNNCYTFQTHNNTGNKVPRTPPHALNLRTHWTIDPNWKLSGEMDARSAAWADEINQETWAGRTLFNVIADYQRKLDWPGGARLTAFVRIDNLFDKNYFNIARGTNDSQSPATASKYDGVYNAEDLSITVNPGRIWRAGLTVRF
jgi:iron complex outermembrane recepter protein